MSFLFPQSEIPEWAYFFTQAEYETFIKCIDDYFKEKQISYELNSDGSLQASSSEMDSKTFWLTNLAQTCKRNAPAYYTEIVSDHFNNMARIFAFKKEFESIASDYQQVEQYIGIKIYPLEYITYIGAEHTISINIVDDIFAVLVFDFPHAIENIKPDQTVPWNRTTEELFEKAKKNSRIHYKFDLIEKGFDNFSAWIIEGDHPFVPNILFELTDHPQLIGPKGALVGIPTRDSAIFHPIDNLQVTKAINTLIPIIYRIDQKGPGSISNKLIWYRDGIFENLPYEIIDNKIEFYPTENFVEMLNSMAG